MSTRERPGDRGAREAREVVAGTLKDLRLARRRVGLSMDTVARRAGMSPSQYGRLELGQLGQPSIEQVFRAARAVGLRPWLKLYPDGEPVRDAPQLKLLAKFEALLAPPLRLRREVPLPVAADLRAWDGRIGEPPDTASVEAESKLDDVQALSRRVELKRRDDPDAGVVILLVNRTAHNRHALATHREALRGQFPLDGGAIARDLRRGRVPRASGILVL